MINPAIGKPPLDSFHNKELGKFVMRANTFHHYPAQEITAYLKRHPNLIVLSINDNALNDDDLEAITLALDGMHSLNILSFKNNSITARGTKLLASALKNHRDIVALEFDGNPIGDEGCIALCPLITQSPLLTDLSFKGNKLTQRSLDVLAKSLEEKICFIRLNLRQNDLGPNDITKLMEVLEKNSALDFIYLGRNKLGDEGIKPVVRVVKKNTSLSVLDFSDNQLGIKGTLAITQALAQHTNIRELYCDDIYIDKELELAILKIFNNNAISMLSISNNNPSYDFLPTFLQWLDTKPQILNLSLRHNGINNSNVLSLAQKISQLPKINKLYLGDNEIDDEGIITFIDVLSANPNPLQLSLEDNRLTPQGITQLENHLQSINVKRKSPLSVRIGKQKEVGRPSDKISEVKYAHYWKLEFQKFTLFLQSEQPSLTSQQLDSLCLVSDPEQKTGFFTDIPEDIFNHVLKEKKDGFEGTSLVYYLVLSTFTRKTVSLDSFKLLALKIQNIAWNYRLSKEHILRLHSPATIFLMSDLISVKEKLNLLLEFPHLISIMDLDALRVLKNIVTREDNAYFTRQYKKFFERLKAEAPASAAPAPASAKKDERESKPISAEELEKLKMGLSGQDRSVTTPSQQKPATLEKQLQLYFPEGKSLIRYTRQNQGNKCCLSFYADTQKVLSDFFASLKPFLGNPPYAGNITVKHAQGKPFSFSLTAKETTLFNFFDNPKLIPFLSASAPASTSGSTSTSSGGSRETRQPLKTLSQEEQSLWKKNLCAFFCNAEELSVLWLDHGFVLLLPREFSVWSVRNYKQKSSERSYFRPSSEFILNQMLLRAQKQYEEAGEAKFEWDSELPVDHQFIKISIYDSHPSVSAESHQKSIFGQLTKEADVALAPLVPPPKITDFDGLQAELARRNSGSKEEIPDDDDDSDYLSDSDEEDFESGSASAAAKPREELPLQDEELALAKLESFVDPATQEIDLPNYCRLLFQLISAAHFAELQEFRFLNIEKLKPGKWDFCFNLVGIPYLQGHEKAINPLLLLEAIQKSLESHQLSIHTNTYEKGGVAHATINQAAVSKLHQTLKDNPLLIRNLQACCANFNLEKSDDSGVSLSTLSQVVAPKSHTAKIIHRSYKHYIGRHQTEEQTKCLINTIRRLEGMPKKNFHYHLNRLQNIPKPQTPDSDKNTVFFYSYLAHTMRVCHLLARQFGFYYPSEFGKKQNTYLRLRNAIRHAANELSWEDFYAAVHPFFTDLKTLQKELPKPTSDVTFFDYLPTKIYIESESVKKLQDLIQQFIARLDAHTLGEDAPEKDYAPILSTIESAELSVVEKRDRRDALIMVHALQHKKEEWHSLDSQLSREYGHEGFDQPYETFAPQLFARYVQPQKKAERPMSAPKIIDSYSRIIRNS